MSDPVHQDSNTDFISGLLPGFISPRTQLAEASCGRLDKDASHYRMDHNRRGLAVVFNQSGCCENERRCVGNDVSSFVKTMTKLGFEIESFDDLNFCEVERALEELSQRDHSDCDCFVLVYLSRGTEGKLRARDRFFDVNCLWGCFTAEKSPTLANKPKVFIVHAYRELSRSGKKGRHGSLIEDCAFIEENDEFENSPGPDRLRSYYIPDRADFLIVISTIQGFVRQGSLYIQTLCNYLDRLGYNQDMLSILTAVNHQILTVTNNSSIPSCDSCKKQLPTIISLLIRTLQFVDKKGTSQIKRNTFSASQISDDEGFEEVDEDSPSHIIPNKMKKMILRACDKRINKKNKLSRPKRKNRKKYIG